MGQKKGTLLIIDDEELIVDRVSILLEDLADKILTASNGKEGLQVLDTNEVNCVLCDINMPVMNGIELIKQVRGKGNNVPFIFYTGHGSQSLMLEVVKYGAFDFLNKPALENLEEIVAKGLKAGTGNAEIEEDGDFVSEYKKLLEDI